MSTSVDQSFIRQFEAEVHEAFQRRGSKILNTVRNKTGVRGYSTTFQRVGTGVATTKARHGVITPMNQDHTPIECILADFYAGDWVDKLDELKLNIDERMVVANGGAWALGRRIDDQIITVLDATTQTAVTFTYTNEGTVRNTLLSAIEALNENDVPDDGDRWGLLTPHTFAAACTVEEFGSADYIGGANLPFTAGNRGQVNPTPMARTWMGVNWLQHSGLPGVGTATAKGFVYHRTAVGYASGQGITSDITWHGDRAAHFVNHWMSGGACMIEDNGVIELTINDTTAIPNA